MEVPIVISGGGIIGNYISLRLEKNNIKTVIVEKASSFTALDKGIRTVTLNEHSMQMLKNIGICPSIAQINSIDVLDGEGTGKIQFLAKDVGSENLSYVTYFNELQKLISDPCKERTFFNNEINSVQNLNTESDPEIMLKDGMTIKTNLIAGCDGRNSTLPVELRRGTPHLRTRRRCGGSRKGIYDKLSHPDFLQPKYFQFNLPQVMAFGDRH